ncbi:uncharacterized protein LOC111385304 [Olea europaea var. sylvestris]|uniref:uncharacterized protein LOC111385304 n=1 Tax=Olea europaea var. sylvestris TaxID=158386 RepID=UPI000C1CDD0E|nr:uncharacterized protein LOC111385304 [Olea europaea var. sylvestris]
MLFGRWVFGIGMEFNLRFSIIVVLKSASFTWILSVERTREMQPPHHHSRIDLTELKVQIVRKLGPEMSKQYFHYLNSFFSLKLNKVEFNKLCLSILGRENIPLHNLFIRSILKNACSAKVPPQATYNDVVKHSTQVNIKEIPTDGYRQNKPQSTMTQASGLPGSAYGGDILLVSPKKARTGSRDRRTGERRSVLGPNGETSFASQHSTATQSSDFNVILENGTLNPLDIGRPMQHHQEPMQQAGNETIKTSSNGPVSVHNNDLTELLVRDEGKEVYSKKLLRAPLGIPLCSVSIGGGRKALPLSSSSRYFSTYNNGALLDNLTLRERMEQIAATQGLEGVSIDSANMLNHGLDCYMKNLIRSCIELVGARCGHDLTKSNIHKHQAYMKLVNSVRPGHQQQMQISGRPLDFQEQKAHCPISLQDFRVAMELNPQQLGEDWSLLLEKICTHAFEE